VRVALASANRSAATVVATGLVAPQQLFLDEAPQRGLRRRVRRHRPPVAHNLTSGLKTAVVSNLNFAVGLVLSSDLQFAYVSEQTTGPDKGRVSRIQISSSARTTLATGLTARSS